MAATAKGHDRGCDSFGSTRRFSHFPEPVLQHVEPLRFALPGVKRQLPRCTGRFHLISSFE